ncbi:MAG: UDP-2,4-diacetamido-2,4,6-trideoxy-beta-L-altropyranose hydrolase [Lachnospiraceae bacterium]
MNTLKPIPKKTLYIRADGNQTIGLGHLMRGLSIADALTELGGSTVFLVADADSEGTILKRGYEVISLHSNWKNLEEELEQLISIISKRQIENLLIDSYYVTKLYLQRLYQHTKVTYLDDLNLFIYPCHTLINYSSYYKKFHYNTNYPQTKLLLGTAYVPLQKAYSKMGKKEINKQVKQVLVLTGGTDEYHFALGMAQQIVKVSEQENRRYVFICGKYNRDLKQLQQLQKECKNIICISNTDNMWNYMKKADVAVSAGGTTLYELCTVGTPTISYLLADNQYENVKSFAAQGLMYDAGDIRKDKNQVIQQILSQIDKLEQKPKERMEIAERMQCLVDGQGARRIAQEITGVE